MPSMNLSAFASQSVRTPESTVAAGQTWLSSVILSLPGILVVMLVVAAGWGIYQRMKMPSNSKAESTVPGGAP